ncbi:hypothetical protein CRE_17214 [Caenorhabditis remanei]|uniref:Uncharacterized protein n=1 Tax=Caenorhabditis remanei TaxID=31234 RepID=E3MA44_CAERE|nr:hypothetical protein CRE_17214 [Caenorhabditis remanei]
MVEMKPFVGAPLRNPDRTPNNWIKELEQCVNGESEAVPVSAFSKNLGSDVSNILMTNINIVVNHEKGANWVAAVEKSYGYFALCRFLGSTHRFWTNYMSDNVHSVEEIGRILDIAPPATFHPKYNGDADLFMEDIKREVSNRQTLPKNFELLKAGKTVSRFNFGQRVELLRCNGQIRVAHIHAVCGRRLNVIVNQCDSPVELVPDDDPQAESDNAENWVDEDSIFLLPVGFATLNGYTLVANGDYIEYTEQIAAAIRAGFQPEYEPGDVRFDDLKKPEISQELMNKVKIGQKCELIDPLSDDFECLVVATVMAKCESPGYVILRLDEDESAFPIHLINVFMYPIGYSENYRLPLEDPRKAKHYSLDGKFDVEDYMRATGATSVPIDEIRPMPPQERMDLFKVSLK